MCRCVLCCTVPVSVRRDVFTLLAPIDMPLRLPARQPLLPA